MTKPKLDTSPASTQPSSPAASQQNAKPRYVVAVGSSAGGLDALLALLRHVERDHMAYVVMQHMDARHESMLPFLLNKTSKMMVAEAKDQTPISAAMIYVCPPGVEARVEGGIIRLTPITKERPKYPIDTLLRSLAEDIGPRAIGVVLSGTGGDGTLGLKAIRGAGGISFAQQPSSALFGGMPQSAIDAHVVDFVLDAEDIGVTLGQIVDVDKTVAPEAPDRLTPGVDGQQRNRVMAAIKSRFGTDLSAYKFTTIDRRFERRMHINKMTDIGEYIETVLTDPDELARFYQDVLINVTAFFRDAEVFDALKAEVLPELLRRFSPLRIWVPACATGEEAYSLAMSIHEVAEELKLEVKLQIFATDLDDNAIVTARRGIYPYSVAADLKGSRLGRFFKRTDEGYQVTRELRDKIVFSRHDMLSDAPFRNIALLSCRNMLIYMTGEAQARVLKTCNQALESTGVLVLGQSESTSDGAEYFTPIDRRRRIFRVTKPSYLQRAQGRLPELYPTGSKVRSAAMQTEPSQDVQLTAKVGVSDAAINGIVIDPNGRMVDVRGRVHAYLMTRVSLLPPSPQLDEHLQPNLRGPFQEAYAEACERRAPASRQCKASLEKRELLTIKVMPFQLERQRPPHHLVIFETQPSPEVGASALEELEDAKDQRAVSAKRRERHTELKGELAVINQYLQRTIEEREAAYEELKVSNEELMSVNEELQCANEELETSREEAQASNEELVTVNDELSRRMVDLDRSRDDLANLLLVSDEAVMVVDLGLRIREYTVKASNLLSLTRQDIGRRIECLQHFLDVAVLRGCAQEVMASLQMAERTILVRNTESYTTRIYPYKTLDFTIGGVVIKLISNENQSHLATILKGGRQYAERCWQSAERPVLVLSGSLRGLWANEAYLNLAPGGDADLVGADLRDLEIAPHSADDFFLNVQDVLRTGVPIRHPVRERLFKQAPEWGRVKITRAMMPSGVPLVVLQFEQGN